MATKKLIIEQMKRLASVHRINLTEDLVNEYFHVLGACLPDDLETAVNEMIASNKYFPKVAEIWEASEKALINRLRTKHGANVNICDPVEIKRHDYKTYAEEA